MPDAKDIEMCVSVCKCVSVSVYVL